MNKNFLAAALAIPLLYGGVASANEVFSGSGTSKDPEAISATIDFSFNALTETLTAVLTNTGAPLSSNPASQASVLTEVLFAGTPLTAGSLPGPTGLAAVTAGSSIVHPDGTTIGQNWQYIAGTGLGTTGIDFGPDGNLCNTPAGCPVPVDGSGFGLVPNGSTLTTDGLPTRPYVENSATYTLQFAAGSPFLLTDISSVKFVYGTGSGDETVLNGSCTSGCTTGLPLGVPEPTSLALLGFGLIGLGFVRRRFFRT